MSYFKALYVGYSFCRWRIRHRAELIGGVPLTKSRTSLELMLQLKTLLTLDSKTGWSLPRGAACQTVVREHKGGATAGG